METRVGALNNIPSSGLHGTMLAVFSIFLACTGTALDPEPALSGQPDILLVTLDTTRADRIGAYGDERAQTPHLDALAANGALFREAITPVPITLPAHASLMTGLYPNEHGLRDNAGYRLGPEHPVLAEQLQAEGYRSAAFVSAFVLDHRFGLERGFAVYDDAVGEGERPAAATVDAALAWWGEPGEGPRMMWVHLFDAHRPYAPKGWDGDPYRGEIAAMDVAVGRLLDAVGEQSLVVVAGDHGENLWDGQELEHGLVLTRSVLRVPLILRPPGGLEGSEAPSAERPPPRPEHWRPVPEIDASAFDLEPVPDAPRAARVIDTPVSLVDLAATMLDYAGGAPAGRSLRALVEGRPLEPLAVYAETLYPYLHYGWAPGFFACSEERVLLRTPSLRSIQPTGDPWWQAATGEEAPLLAALIDQHGVLDDMPGESPDEEEIQRLAALGYSTLRVRSAEDWEQLPDAADRMTLLHRVFVAQGKMASDPAQAEEELLAALAHDEGLVDAWYSVASLRVNRLDREGALEALDRLLESAPTHLHALRLKLALLRALERHEEALAVTELLLSLTPLELQAHREVVATLLALERDPTSTARAGLEIDAQDCYLNHTMGVKLVQSDPTAALEHLERVRAADCPAQQTHLYEGLAYRALGQVEPALSAFAEQAKLTPQDLTPVHYQVELLLEVQDCERALALLETLYTNRRDPETLQKYRDCGGTGF